MTDRPKFGLGRLRKIGWNLWDPIGLGGLDADVEDEYDSYLLEAAGRIWNGASEEEVIDYLVTVETEHMGLGEGPRTRQRAREAAKALGAYVAELRR
jgi:hypothetical protein